MTSTFQVVKIGKKESRMAVKNKTKKGKAHENKTKEGPRTGVRTSGETNSPPGQPSLHSVGSGGGDKT